MAITNKEVQPNEEGKFLCPECGHPSNDRAHLGIHRQLKHGIEGRTHGKGATKVTQTRNVSDKEIAKMRELRAQGKTREEIANATGRSQASVDRHVRGLAKGGKNGSGKPTPREITKIFDMRAKGMSLREIGESLGRSPSYADYYLRKARKNGQPAVKARRSKTPTQERTQHVNGNSHTDEPQAFAPYERDLIYFFAGTEERAKLYCEANQIPWPFFASGLADLFKIAGGGVRHRVSPLRDKTA